MGGNGAYRFMLKRLEKFREPIWGEHMVHHTPKRFLNYLLANLEHRMGRLRLISRPYHAFIDPSDICNLNCPLCVARKGTQERQNKCMMRLSDFKRVIDELSGHLYSIYLCNRGEPVLNPDIFEMIRYAKSKGIAVLVSSNLNIRIKNFGEKIVESGIDHIHVPIEGTDQETYAKYRRGGNYALVRSNLREILEAKKAAGSSKPYAVVGCIVMRHNEAGIADFKKEMRTTGVDLVYIGRVLLKDYEKEKGWLPLNEDFNGYLPSGKRKQPFTNCSYPWTTAVIFPDMGVSFCCWNHYLDGERLIGSLRDGAFSDSWNSPAYAGIRRVLRDKAPNAKIPCSDCISGHHPHKVEIEMV